MRKKTALYDPYLDTFGGGEKHILSILKVLGDEGHDITIFWDDDVSSILEDRLNIQFKNLTFKPNIFKGSSLTRKLSQLAQYDFFFYVTNGSYFFSTAKHNYIFSMYPQKSLYDFSLVNKLKTLNYKFITNSQYTQKKLSDWNIPSEYIYPFLEDNFFEKKNIKKEKTILNVGRFFTHLHSKRQDLVVKTFIDFKIKHKELENYSLVLAGSLKEEDKPFFDTLEQLSQGRTDIRLLPNIPYAELLNLYRTSQFYWHFAGYGTDEEKTPELVEHLGITPIEAMSQECVVFCHSSGGPKEIIKDKYNGFLFSDFEELEKKFIDILENIQQQEEIIKNSGKYIRENFTYDVFKQKVKSILRI